MRYFFQYLVAIVLCLSTFWTIPTYAKQKFVVVIDPGHGGRDAGTTRRNCKMDEKTVALNVALQVGKRIEQTYKDVKVVYTRKTDTTLALSDRVQTAKQAKGDFYISIHVNASTKPGPHGFGTYYFGRGNSDGDINKRVEDRLLEERENLDITGRAVNFDTDIDLETKMLCQALREKHNKQSEEAARDMQSSIMSAIKKTSYGPKAKNCGVFRQNIFVLCFSPMPAILVELGYMSNPEEERFLTSTQGQQAFVDGIFNGFKTYKSKWDKRQLNGSGGGTVAAEPTPAPADEHVIAESKPANADPKPVAPDSKPIDATGDVVWRIQFLTSEKLLKEGAKELKGLSPVSHYKEGKVYKYTYGSASTSKALSKDLKMVQQKFPSAFPVKFDASGARIKN